MKTTFLALWMITSCATALGQGHPRLFFSAADKSAITERIEEKGSAAKALFAEIAQQRDYYMTHDLHTTDGKPRHYESIPSLAFSYFVYGNTSWADRACSLVFRSGTIDTQGIIRDQVSEGFDVAFRINALALVYDFMYDYLSQAQRIQIQDTIVADLNKPGVMRSYLLAANAHIQNNHLAHHALALATGAMAIYGENAAYSTSQADADIVLAKQIILTNSDSYLKRMWSPEDGAYLEGVAYNFWGGVLVVQLMELLSRWESVDYFQDSYAAARLPKVVDWLCYEMLPQPRQYYSQYNVLNQSGPAVKGASSLLLMLAPHYPAKAGLVRWLFNNTIQSISNLLVDPDDANDDRSGNGNTMLFLMPLLTYDYSTAVPPSSLAFSRLFTRDGLVYFRTSSSWADANDIQVAVSSSPVFDPIDGWFSVKHDHADKSQLTLSAFGDQYIVDRDASGDATRRPETHNYITIDNRGQAIGTDISGGIESDGWYPRSGKVIGAQLTSSWSFLHTDAKSAFGCLWRERDGVPQAILDGDPFFSGKANAYVNPVRNADRYLVFAQPIDGLPAYLVIGDDIQKDSVSPVAHNYSWLFHSDNSVSIGSPPATVQVTGSYGNLTVYSQAASPVSFSPYPIGNRYEIATSAVNPFFHVVLFPRKTGMSAPAVSIQTDASNGSCWKLLWAGFTDYNLFRRNNGEASSSGIATNAKLIQVRTTTAGGIWSFCLGEGTYAKYNSAVLADLFGASGTVTSAGGRVTIDGSAVACFRVYAPAATSVTLNGTSVSFAQCDNYVTSLEANQNQSTSSNALCMNSQRKLFRESSGKLHEVFESSGFIYYRNSTNDGASWAATSMISDPALQGGAPCLTLCGSTVLVVWQSGTGDYTIKLRRSTNGGSSWLSIQNIVAHVERSDPGPIPSISGYTDGSAFVAYSDEGHTRITCYKSTNSGSSWSSIGGVPGSTEVCNMPSGAINTTYWSTDQANVAYATDLPANSPSIEYNYYDLQTASWGSTIDLCAIVPSSYSHHANPSLAVSADQSYKTVHVAWDADDTSPGNKVIIHRKGGFRSFSSVYSVLAYQGIAKPSIAGVSQEKAWVVYQNASGNSVWKRYYDGSNWNYGTWVANGFNPQISIGSTGAKYLWMSGSSSPYQINLGSETLSKTGDDLAYSRALNVIDTLRKAFVALELAPGRAVTKAKQILPLALSDVAGDSTEFGMSELQNAGSSVEFALPSDADTLYLPVAIYGIGADKLFKSEGSVGLSILNSNSGTVLLRAFSISGSSIGKKSRELEELQVPVAQIALSSKGARLKVKPEFIGIRSDLAPVFSVGHIYKQGSGATVAKPGSGEPIASATEKPTSFDLQQNYPNPFNPSTSIEYRLPKDGKVSLRVYDQLGREVKELVSGFKSAGRYEVQWNASGVSSGLYYARFIVLDEFGKVQFSKVNKLLLTK